MYIFELTDQEIIIYDKKRKKLIKEIISERIIVDNKIYDYLKFVKVLNNIILKNRIIKSIFRIKIKILIFEECSPSEIYLIKKAFNSISNFDTQIVYINRYFEDNTIFISGKNLYYKNKVLKNIKKGEYVLIGNTNDYDYLKKTLTNKFKIELLEYENSNTIIYEKV